MKIILLAIATLIFQISVAQDPQLLENTWYLQELIVNNISYPAPNNSEVSEVPANFYPVNPNEEFNTAICNSASGIDIIYNNANSSFAFPNGLAITFIVCKDPYNFTFEINYFQEFFFDNDINPFIYEIVSSGNSKSLILTSQDGDQAIYGDELLAISELALTTFSVYPNPFTSTIAIQSDISFKNVSIYNVLGQNVMQKMFKNGTKTVSLEVTSLKSGLYFAVIEDERGHRLVKRLVKK